LKAPPWTTSVNVMKALLVGKNSFLGSHLLPALAFPDVVATGSKELDLSGISKERVDSLFREGKFSHLIVCAAVSDVNQCFFHQKASHAVNVDGLQLLFQSAKEFGVFPIFFSSDYVFGFEGKFFSETDQRKPNTIYGQQKLAIEEFLQTEFQDYLIFRTSKLMSKAAHQRNILFPILESLAKGKEVRCFVDQWITPVFVEDVANAINLCLKNRASGIYHLATNTVFSRYEIARLLASHFAWKEDLIRPIRLRDLEFPEVRSHYNTISSEKMQRELGFRFTEIEESLEELKKLL